MPKQTFFNLPREKRARILDAALVEMGSKPFDNVSVAEIVEKAGIPRGSFYQYFEDLKDLYRHVLTVVGEEKIRYMDHVVRQLDSWDVFKIIRELYTAGLQFAAENPRLAAVGNYFFREDLSLKKELFPHLEDQGKDFFRRILGRGREKGEIDPGVDISMAALILYNLTNDITEYYIETTEKEKDLFADKEDYMKLVDQMLYILEAGLKTRKRG